jgi:hypothetical protein
MAREGELSREYDARRCQAFAQIGNRVDAVLTVNTAESKAISDKLVGVFFERYQLCGRRRTVCRTGAEP